MVRTYRRDLIERARKASERQELRIRRQKSFEAAVNGEESLVSIVPSGLVPFNWAVVVQGKYTGWVKAGRHFIRYSAAEQYFEELRGKYTTDIASLLVP